MLLLNLKRVFALRGIENPAFFMVSNGINRQTTNNLLQQRTSVVKLDHLQLLCRLLNCTPNDFFVWEDDAANPLSATHSLNDLKRTMTAQNILQIAKDVPLGEVEQLIDARKTQK